MLDRLQTLLKNALTDSDAEAREGGLRTPNDAQLAAASLLIAMARSDFELREEEKHAIRASAARLLDRSGSELDALLDQAEARFEASVSLYDFTQVIHRELDRTEKLQIIEELWRIAWSDGAVDPAEDHLVRKVARLLHIDHRDFIGAKLRVRDETPS